MKTLSELLRMMVMMKTNVEIQQEKLIATSFVTNYNSSFAGSLYVPTSRIYKVDIIYFEVFFYNLVLQHEKGGSEGLMSQSNEKNLKMNSS